VGIEAGIEPGPVALSLSVTNAGFPEAPETTSAKRQAMLAYAVIKPATVGYSYVIDPAPADEKGRVKERRIAGAFAGLTAGRFTGLIEDDWIDDKAQNTLPEMGLAELNCLIVQGHNVKLLYEFFDPDRKHDGDIRDRTSVIYEPFLYAPLQFRFGLRRAVGPVSDTASNYRKVFVELHAIY
jgi:hypothetical protein